jgi:lysophospholipase L1-like esterase
MEKKVGLKYGLILALICVIDFVSNANAQGLLTPGSYTIVAFGDSTTEEDPVRVEGDVYSQILEKELPTYGITGMIVNAGIPSNTSLQGYNRLQSDVLDYNPDLVIVQFGINDAAVDVWKNPPATEPRVSLNDYIHNMTNIVQDIKATGSKVILMTPNPCRWTEILLTYYGYEPYDPEDPMGFNVMLTDYAQAVRDLAVSEDVPLVDVYSSFVAYNDVVGQSMDDLLADGMHPNYLGHEIIGDALIHEISGVPEPGTLIVLTAGGLIAICRKKTVKLGDNA